MLAENGRKRVNYIVYALGLKGRVKGKVLDPYREGDGTFPIYSEDLQRKNVSDKIQKEENKVAGVSDIAKAVSLIRAGGHRWRLKEYETGQKNIFKREHIRIHEV
jgi:hypothetical protein